MPQPLREALRPHAGVLRDGHILRILVREMFIDKGLDVCEARTLRGPVAALPVNDFVVLAAASYADRLQLARLCILRASSSSDDSFRLRRGL